MLRALLGLDSSILLLENRLFAPLGVLQDEVNAADRPNATLENCLFLDFLANRYLMPLMAVLRRFLVG